jgi:hypothetical protein
MTWPDTPGTRPHRRSGLRRCPWCNLSPTRAPRTPQTPTQPTLRCWPPWPPARTRRARRRLNAHATRARHTDSPRPHSGVVYSNILPLNHDVAARPALQESPFFVGVAVQCLLLPWLGTLPGEVAADATVKAPPFARASTTPACPGMHAARPVVVVVSAVTSMVAATTPASSARMYLPLSLGE